MFRSAFTLIELLVVITIIVLLLSLLTPAMDKAIYEAEMAQDQANMRGVAQTAPLYAFDHNRKYPYREDVRGSVATSNNGTGFVDPIDYSSPNNIRDNRQNMNYDLRRTMEGYLSVIQLECPFTAKVDLWNNGSNGNTMISADYNLFFGWQYKGKKGMFKIGDKWTGRANIVSDVIVSDVDTIFDDDSNALTWGSHPDDLGVRGEFVWQNFGDAGQGNAQASANAYGGITGDPNFSWTYSFWDSRAGSGGWRRGTVDSNYTYADLSTERFNKVEIDHDTKELDERMVNARYYRNGAKPNLIIPKRP